MKKLNFFKSIIICLIILPCVLFVSACGKGKNYAEIKAVSVNVDGEYETCTLPNCRNYFKGEQANKNFDSGIRFSILQETILTNDNTTKNLKEVVDGIISLQNQNVYGIAKGKYTLDDGESKQNSYANFYRINNTCYKDDGKTKQRGTDGLFVELPIGYNVDEIYSYLEKQSKISNYYDYNTTFENKFIHKIKITMSSGNVRHIYYFIFENGVLTGINIESLTISSNKSIHYIFNCVGFEGGNIYMPSFEDYI